METPLPTEETSRILITNANVFDGTHEKLATGMSVLVEGNKIAKVAKSVTAPDGAAVIDAQGRTLTPGFIGAHEHIMLQLSFSEFYAADTRYYAIVATQTARTYLMNGWTSIRDIGNSFSLKKAIDRGIVLGPRIFPSGTMLSQTAGHADHRLDSDPSTQVGGRPDVGVLNEDMAVVDGVPEVLKAARDNLRRGATQIKIAVGGGFGSYSDPLEVVGFTPEEIRAAVQAAEDYKTYVMAHIYNNEGIRRAIENGVKSIEHGNLVDEPTLQRMKEEGIWLSPQVIVFANEPIGLNAEQKRKHAEAYAGIDNMFRLCKKIGFERIVFGSDIITDPELIARISEEFVLRTKWFAPVEILRQATSRGGELLDLSKRFSPGKLGMIEEGALADLLLISGDPLKDMSILTKPDENLALIMKDGRIYKNTLS
jgi:imidazolonepropionase-like amidohydrolase